MARKRTSELEAQRSRAGRSERPAIIRAIRLVEATANIGRPATLAELAGIVGLPIATAFRLCQRLEDADYLVRDPASRRYTVSVRLVRLSLDVLRASGPSSSRRRIMSKLVEEIGETCNLTTLGGTDVLYLDRVETKWPLRLTLEPGSRVPIHCTASGKLFLAFMPKDLRGRIMATLSLTANTEKTITQKGDLDRELQRIVRRGYSTDNEEFLDGLVAVAVPVKNRSGLVFAAVACHAPMARFDLKTLAAQVPRLEAAAAMIALTFI